MRHFEEFTVDDGIHEQYAKVDIELPCIADDLYFLDYKHSHCWFTPTSNRFAFYARKGRRIDWYELNNLVDNNAIDIYNVKVLDCKLSDYDDAYVGYQLMVKLDIDDDIFNVDTGELNFNKAKHPNRKEPL